MTKEYREHLILRKTLKITSQIADLITFLLVSIVFMIDWLRVTGG